MRIGTADFQTIAAARRYYARQGEEDAAEAVRIKLAEGAISIGEPSNIREGESFSWDKDGRGQLDF